MRTHGKKEIQEAVITAALVTIATGVIGIAFELLKKRIFVKKEELNSNAVPSPTGDRKRV